MSAVALDRLDLAILDALQTDCAVSNRELALRVRTSAATCLRRVERLVDSGVIERRIAILAPDRWTTGPGSALTAIVEVTLDRQAAEPQEAFEQRAIADPAVRQCYRVTPGPDFVLIVEVPGMDGYQALVRRLLTSDANVRNVRTYFSVGRGKFDPRVALPPAERGPAAL